MLINFTRNRSSDVFVSRYFDRIAPSTLVEMLCRALERGSAVRYMATSIGNSRFPFTEKNRQTKLGVDLSVKDGGGQIDFADHHRVHEMYLNTLAKNGVTCKMANFSRSETPQDT